MALVTGAARGIGQACAVTLARAGADVAAADLLPTADAERAIVGHGRRALGLSLDVTDPDAVRRGIGRVVAALGRLDVLVTAAGILHRDTLEETTEARCGGASSTSC